MIFRRWPDGEIDALFPYDIADHRGNVTCYAHVGQHGSADYDHCIESTKPAKQAESLTLKQELETLGYKIRIVKRRNYKKYLKSYYEVLNTCKTRRHRHE